MAPMTDSCGSSSFVDLTDGLQFGDKGPDRYLFLIDGLLERVYERRALDFRVSGQELRIRVDGIRAIEPWQCPDYPNASERPEHTWDRAWEFTGFATSTRNAYHIHGIYSPFSRKGAYRFWKLHGLDQEKCAQARTNLMRFFANTSNDEALLGLEVAMDHMTRGSAVGGRHVDCQECWELFKQLRQSCELP